MMFHHKLPISVSVYNIHDDLMAAKSCCSRIIDLKFELEGGCVLDTTSISALQKHSSIQGFNLFESYLSTCHVHLICKRNNSWPIKIYCSKFRGKLILG